MTALPTTPPALIAARREDGWEYYELVDPAEMRGQLYWRYNLDWFYTPIQMADLLADMPWVLINPDEILAAQQALTTDRTDS